MLTLSSVEYSCSCGMNYGRFVGWFDSELCCEIRTRVAILYSNRDFKRNIHKIFWECLLLPVWDTVVNVR